MYEILPIQVIPGVEAAEDQRSTTTKHYVSAEKIRFVGGYPEKIGGWQSVLYENQGQVTGCPRLLFSYILSGVSWNIIGTHTSLFSLLGSQLTNITPLTTTTTAIADSLDTYYKALANNPITTVNGSSTITISDTATKVRVGDTITISGVPGDVNGIPVAQLNTTHFVRSQATDSFTVIVSTAATSSGSGGGASVVLATGILTVNQTAHGYPSGNRLKITGAADTGGILAAQINLEFVTRNVQANTYDILTTGTATSAVTAGGGASTEVQPEIADGLCDASLGSGYGLGRYGVGLYGVAKTSTTGASLPRLWAADRFGDLVVLTPGNQTGLYSWDSDTQEAPALVANAPTAINYAFVSNEICVTLGADGIENRIKSSDQGVLTTWTPTSVNQAYEDDIEGAGRFISHAPVRGSNLIFTENQTYTFRYIGPPFVWEVRLLDPSIGIIAQNARVSYNGIVYWMGQENFYYYEGGRVEIIPSNSGPQTTLKDKIFNNLNYAQKSKIFAWVNKDFNEIWWHYPTAGSLDPNAVARFNFIERHWVPDSFARTATEYPTALSQFPRLINHSGVLFNHEVGYNDDGEPLPWSIGLPSNNSGTNTADHGGFVPDSTQDGDIRVTVNFKKYPQSQATITHGPYTVSPSTEKVTEYTANGRVWNYEIEGDDLDQFWRAGQWYELIKESTRR